MGVQAVITAEQLAAIVSRTVALKKRGDRWVGLCPWHNDHRPSFHVFKGKDGQGHCFSQSCKKSCSARWWLQEVEGKSYRETGTGIRPDPQIARDRQERQRRLQMLHEFRDRNPDCGVPDDFLLDHPAWLTT